MGSRTNLDALNDRQREAVVSDDKRLLVLAGAGSGKTKTLLQKIIYLIEEKGVNPYQILAITFTKNAANEMIDRLIMSADESKEYEKQIFKKGLTAKDKRNLRLDFQRKYSWISRLTIKTFHSFCFTVLRTHGVNEFDNKFKIIGEEKRAEEDDLSVYLAPITVFEVFHKLLIEQCSDTDYLIRLKRYILDYFVDQIHIQNHNKENLPKDGKYYTALNGTRVRSKSEQYIADWLYRHNIKFEYEPKVNIRDFEFHPDFYIPEANLYLEHVSNLSAPTAGKEEQFRKGNIHYVKTYESMARDSALFNAALDKIIKSRLPANYSKTVALSYQEAFHRYHEQVTDFIQQVMRVLDMIKVENKDISDVTERARKDQHERVRHFYELALPVMIKFRDYCVNKSFLDFNDLITRCISLFRNSPEIAQIYRDRYRYILVDEFQDVNSLQVDLLKLLLTDSSQLFCVGDDWQSIYGFRGSNVGYIVEFEKHFDNARTVKLNLNYRSTQHIVQASNEVIKNNKFRIDKEIIASKKSEHKIVIYAGRDEWDNVEFCVKKVKELIQENVPVDEITFLYRRSKMFQEYSKRFKLEQLNVQGRTIHAAKGLESSVVFLIGLTEGSGGFPDIWLEDRIFQVVKKANYDLLMEEERRLFYVAITRAKDKLFLITRLGQESSFLREIPEMYTVRVSDLLKPVVDRVIICSRCYSQLEKLWIVCPYCGNPVPQ
ncbi:MAG: ATP-dependent helicase [Cyclobacteriaceae bacterium]|nr:ATP-dependent helicase [Cyclobacteriaceae bacterium]MCX7638393.1 ATP-dependent helicase [Cyclobacteriaceae bacterium]MDW8330207.1 ATP-dependent helicase [Cyclobacteriaceae bacterium]